MFDTFLKQYIQDYFECCDYTIATRKKEGKELKKEDIDDMVDDITNNDYLWEIMDELVLNTLDRYGYIDWGE